jgi:hypothetical protein
MRFSTHLKKQIEKVRNGGNDQHKKRRAAVSLDFQWGVSKTNVLVSEHAKSSRRNKCVTIGDGRSRTAVRRTQLPRA